MYEDRDEEDRQRRQFTRRALLAGGVKLGALGLIGTHLYRVQVVDGARYVPIADDNRIDVQLIAPARGRILDRFGEVLATNKESYRAVVVPGLAGDLRRVVALFSRLVPLSPEEQARIIERARRQARVLPVRLAGDLTFEQVAEINLQAPSLPGVRTEIERRRDYVHSRAVGHVVGFVGALERPALDDEPIMRLPGMRIGKTGIERGMEARLRGEGGHVKHEVDARGRIVRELEQADAIPGRDVVLTLDTGLQARVLDRLQTYRQAALVGLDIASGEVLVMASVPTLDAHHAAPRLGPGGRPRPLTHGSMVNRAIRGTYPPGSTFKMVTALAALEAGVVSPRERITCQGKFEYHKHTYRCWQRRGHGGCDMNRALRESCDVYFYELARRTGIDAIARMARRLGFGQTFDCGIAHQRPGVVPDPDWKITHVGKPWLGGETILAGIGQGFVLANPLQLAVMMARLAGGRAVEPTLVRPQSGDATRHDAALGLNPAWLDVIRRGLAAAVNDDSGTGHNARIEDRSYRLAGKTGTAQVSSRSADRSGDLPWEQRDHALFVGYAPAEAPRYAVAAIVEHGGGGGQTAAPLVRDVMTLLVDQDPARRPAYMGAAPPAPRLRDRREG